MTTIDPNQLWKTILSQLEVQVSTPVFGTFFTKTKLLSFENSVATIGCNNTVSVNMIENRYYALIKSHFDKHTGTSCSLIFKVLPSEAQTIASAGPLFADLPQITMPQPPVQGPKKNNLRTDLTFDTFAVSTSNHMAYAAATAVAASPGTSYNPLFLYGGVGVGKTHLMQAIGNEIVKTKPGSKVIYCMGEEFTNDIIDAIQTKNTKKFKDRYRSAQIFLIDDIQFIAGKNAVQEEFFHTFNTIQRFGGQVVMTSDRPPQEINKLEERLRSRFEAGLLVDVQNPDFELRAAIIRIKAQQKNVDLPINIAQILAASTDSVRKLEGLLTRFLSEASLKHLPISEELAHSVVGAPANSNPDVIHNRMVTPKQVMEAIGKRFGVTQAQLKGPVRSRPIARPRQLLMYILRSELGLPFEEVGALVGGRDHTTVMHAVQTITTLQTADNRMREDISWIKKDLFG